LNVAPAQINPQAALGDFGLSSACAVELQARLQAILGVALSTTMVWQHPSLDALISYIVNAVETQLLGADQGSSDHVVGRPHLPDPILSGADVVQLSSEAAQALLNRQLTTVLSAETGFGRCPRPPHKPRFAPTAIAPDDSQHLPDDTVTQLLFKELNKSPS
jgi:acyl carrier protein